MRYIVCPLFLFALVSAAKGQTPTVQGNVGLLGCRLCARRAIRLCAYLRRKNSRKIMQSCLRAAMELRLTVKRSGETIQLGMESGTYETANGKVVGVFLKHFLGKAKTLEITGIVDGPLAAADARQNQEPQPAPWNPDVIGLARQQRLWQDRNVKPGDQFSYLTFEPSINLVVKTTVTAKDYEDVELFGGQRKRRLLRVESRPEKIQNVQLPTLVSWLGDEQSPLRSEADIPPFGRVTFYRTSKAMALSSEGAGKLTDIGTSQHIKLAKRIDCPYETASAVSSDPSRRTGCNRGIRWRRAPACEECAWQYFRTTSRRWQSKTRKRQRGSFRIYPKLLFYHCE